MAQTIDTPRHVIKRYAGVRFYDTLTLSYLTVDNVRALLHADTGVVVFDAESGEDVTLSTVSLTR